MGKNKLPKDLGIKLGSDEMVYWRNLIEAKKRDIKITEENLKFYKFIVYYAEKEYQKAEEEFNKVKS